MNLFINYGNNYRFTTLILLLAAEAETVPGSAKLMLKNKPRKSKITADDVRNSTLLKTDLCS